MPGTPHARRVRYGYLEAAIRSELEHVATASEGERNCALFRAAAALGRFVADGRINEGAAIGKLVAAAEATHLPRYEAERTARSGIAAARKDA